MRQSPDAAGSVKTYEAVEKVVVIARAGLFLCGAPACVAEATSARRRPGERALPPEASNEV
jgi:hypothetical protein